MSFTVTPDSPVRDRPRAVWTDEAPCRGVALHTYVRGVERGWRWLTGDELARLAAAVAKREQAEREQAKASNTP